MSQSFPEITSFGTLLGYALALEEAVAGLAGEAAEREGCRRWREPLLACAQKHGKRARQLERLRRERLNEVVLQDVSGMEGADYCPPENLPADGAEAVQAVAEAEERVAGFYRDASTHAKHVLGGLGRSFTKMMAQSSEMAAKLRGH